MDSSIELESMDRSRINNNINILKEKEIPYLEYMICIPIDSLTDDSV